MRRKIKGLNLRMKKTIFKALGIAGKIKTKTCSLTVSQWVRVHESYGCPKNIRSFIRKKIASMRTSLEELGKAFEYLRKHDFMMRVPEESIFLNNLLRVKLLETLKNPEKILEYVYKSQLSLEKTYIILSKLKNNNFSDWYKAYDFYFVQHNPEFGKIKRLIQKKLSYLKSWRLPKKKDGFNILATLSIFDKDALNVLKMSVRTFDRWFNTCRSFGKSHTDFPEDYYKLCYDGLLSETKTPKECIRASEVIPNGMVDLLTDKMISLSGSMNENVEYYKLHPSEKLLNVIQEYNSSVMDLAVLAFSRIPELISLAFKKIKNIRFSPEELIAAHIDINKEYDWHYDQIPGPNGYYVRLRDYFLDLILELLSNNEDKGNFQLWHDAFKKAGYSDQKLEEFAMEAVLLFVNDVPCCIDCLIHDKYIATSYYKTELRKILSALDAEFKVWSNININDIEEDQELRDIIIEKTVRSAKTWKQKMKLRLDYKYDKFFPILDKDLV